MTATTQATDLLGVQELADRLGVSTSTALRRIQSGEIPAQKLRGKTGAWVIKASDLPDIPDPQNEPDEFAA